MKRFFTTDDAVAWLSEKTGWRLSEGDVLRANEAGQLPVCFRYRGKLGHFPPYPKINPEGQTIPTQIIFPKPSFTCYFDGYLRSLSRIRLGVITNVLKTRKTATEIQVREITTKGNILWADMVEPIVTIGSDPKFDNPKASDGSFWGVLGQNGFLDRWHKVSADDWLFFIDDLMGYLERSRELPNNDPESIGGQRDNQSLASAEKSCLEWLVGLMSENSQPTKIKPDYRKEAEEMCKGLSDRGFIRAWANAQTITDNSNWGRAGRKPKKS